MKNQQKPTSTEAALPSPTRQLALAASADAKLQNKTSMAQFKAMLEMDEIELGCWLASLLD